MWVFLVRDSSWRLIRFGERWGCWWWVSKQMKTIDRWVHPTSLSQSEARVTWGLSFHDYESNDVVSDAHVRWVTEKDVSEGARFHRLFCLTATLEILFDHTVVLYIPTSSFPLKPNCLWFQGEGGMRMVQGRSRSKRINYGLESIDSDSHRGREMEKFGKSQTAK